MNFSKMSRPGRAKVQTPRGTMTIAATNERRAVYEEIKRLEKGNPGAIITDGYLRLEAVLASGANNTLSAINFSVLSNQGTTAQRTSEQRLNPSDAFYIERIGMFFAYQKDAATLATQAALSTFPNGAVFGAANVAPLRGITSGSLSIKVNSVEYMRSLDILGLQFVGTAQEAVAPSAGDLWEASAFDLDAQLYRLTPTIRLNGGSTNEIRVQLGDPQTFTAAAGVTIALVLYCKGWLAQNCGRFNPLQGQ